MRFNEFQSKWSCENSRGGGGLKIMLRKIFLKNQNERVTSISGTLVKKFHFNSKGTGACLYGSMHTLSISFLLVIFAYISFFFQIPSLSYFNSLSSNFLFVFSCTVWAGRLFFFFFFFHSRLHRQYVIE